MENSKHDNKHEVKQDVKHEVKTIYRAAVYIDYVPHPEDRRRKKFSKLLKRIEKVLTAISDEIEIKAVSDFEPIYMKDNIVVGIGTGTKVVCQDYEEYTVELPLKRTYGIIE